MRILGAVAIALMGMGGVALGAPRDDLGPPEQAQGNGPPPQTLDPTPAAEIKEKVKGQKGGPAEVPHELAPQAGGDDNSDSGGHESRRGDAPGGAGHYGVLAPPEARGQARSRSNAGTISVCRSAGCRGGTPEPSPGRNGGGHKQSKDSGGQQAAPAPGEVVRSAAYGDDEQDGTAPGERQIGTAVKSGSGLGLNQDRGDEAKASRGFDGALPFTGLQLLVMTAVGLALALAGVRLRRLGP